MPFFSPYLSIFVRLSTQCPVLTPGRRGNVQLNFWIIIQSNYFKVIRIKVITLQNTLSDGKKDPLLQPAFNSNSSIYSKFLCDSVVKRKACNSLQAHCLQQMYMIFLPQFVPSRPLYCCEKYDGHSLYLFSPLLKANSIADDKNINFISQLKEQVSWLKVEISSSLSLQINGALTTITLLGNGFGQKAWISCE